MTVWKEELKVGLSVLLGAMAGSALYDMMKRKMTCDWGWIIAMVISTGTLIFVLIDRKR